MSVKTKHGFSYKEGFHRAKLVEDTSPLDFKELRHYQKRFVRELHDEPYWFIEAPPAAGKTLTIAALITKKLEADPSLRALIVVPQRIIGSGFEGAMFLLGKREVFFDPGTKLHDQSEKSNTSQIEHFLTKPLTSHVNDRTLICTHLSLVLAYKTFPELFRDVLLVVDEAHHSSASEIEEENHTNGLGGVVIRLIEAGEQVGLATATASRGDGNELLGSHRDKFVVSSCPFDEYMGVCKWFKEFDINFLLYENDLALPIHQMLGDMRKRPRCTIVHIPNVLSGYSSGKNKDVKSVYRGIAGGGKPKVKNPSGKGNGITEIQRGRHRVRVVNLVDKRNREIKKDTILAAHDDPTSERIDVIIALNMFKEGANWRWAENSIIIGHRGSFTELAQIVGRGLRDAPEKYHTDIHYVLECSQQDVQDDPSDVLNNYLKALLFVLLLEDVFKPVKIRVKNKKTGKRRLAKTDLLAEALGHDYNEKTRIDKLVLEELARTKGEPSFNTSVNMVVNVLEQEGVEHATVSTRDIARQIMKSHARKASTINRIKKDAERLEVKNIDVDLLQESKHPLAYLTYYTEGIGISTLVGLRKALHLSNEARWWRNYRLLENFVRQHHRLPKVDDIVQGVKLGVWIGRQRYIKHKGLLGDKFIEAMEKIPGWRWLVTGWRYSYSLLVEFVKIYKRLPVVEERYKDRRLGAWVGLQRRSYRKGTLPKDRIEALTQISCWVWDRNSNLREAHEEEWSRYLVKLQDYMRRYGDFPPLSHHSGKWLERQRKNKDKLSPEQVYQLEQLHPQKVWVGAIWYERLQEASQFFQNFGRRPITRGKNTLESILGGWLASQVHYYNSREMAPDRRKMFKSELGAYVDLKNLSSTRYVSPRKQQARFDTIIEFYRSHFSLKKLPFNKQYWSMAAQCVNNNGHKGTLLPNAELHQLVMAKLIYPYQFHGVDHNEDVFQANCLYEGSNWYRGDFYDALSEALDKDPEFNPGIVNVDTVSEPRAGVELFSKVLHRLAHINDVLFVGNFIMKNRGNWHTLNDLMKILQANPKFRQVAPYLQWDENRTLYTYYGSTKGKRTVMTTIMMWRR